MKITLKKWSFICDNGVVPKAQIPNTALFNPKKKFPEQGSGLSSLGRIIRTHKVSVVVVSPCFCPKSGKFSRGAALPISHCPVDRSWCAQRCCAGAATESLLRRSCAAAAATELLSSSSLLDVLSAARSWQRLEEGRELRAASAPSQQHQLRRSSISSVAAASALCTQHVSRRPGDGSVPRR